MQRSNNQVVERTGRLLCTEINKCRHKMGLERIIVKFNDEFISSKSDIEFAALSNLRRCFSNSKSADIPMKDKVLARAIWKLQGRLNRLKR